MESSTFDPQTLQSRDRENDIVAFLQNQKPPNPKSQQSSIISALNCLRRFELQQFAAPRNSLLAVRVAKLLHAQTLLEKAIIEKHGGTIGFDSGAQISTMF